LCSIRTTLLLLQEVIHNYSLTISYPDTGANQNYDGKTGTQNETNSNQNKHVSAFITIHEVNAENPYNPGNGN